MKSLAIYGAGGFGQEVKGMLDMQPAKFAFSGFIDDFKNDLVQKAEHDYDDVLFAIADPQVRRRLVNAWNQKPVVFASLLSEDVNIHPSVMIERGVIICPGVKLTVDIVIGEFCIVNLNTTIGHDARIGKFTSIMPSVNISGNVTVGEGVFIGSGATILQGVTIGDNVIVGAGSLVNKNIPSNCTVIGMPARITKLNPS